MPPEHVPFLDSLFSRGISTFCVILLSLTIVPPNSALAADAAARPPSNVTYDSQSFVVELGRLKAELESARRSTETLRSYRESLPAAWTVQAGNRHFDVPTDLLVSQIGIAERQPEIRSKEVNQAESYLDALAAETSSLSEGMHTQTESARSKLNAILSRPEYAHAVQQSWFDRLRNHINEMLGNALLRIFRSVGSQASLGYYLLWLVICAAAVFIAYWIFRRWIRAAKGEEMALQSAVPLRSWQEWIFSAREAAARTDYRLAVHCAYWAGIARLQEVGALSPDRAKTPREYLAILEKPRMVAPEILAGRRQALYTLTSRLEKIWYGYHHATEADFRDSLAQLETLGCHLP